MLTYAELIENAEKAYQSYIDESRKISHLVQILDRIDDEIAASHWSDHQTNSAGALDGAGITPR